MRGGMWVLVLLLLSLTTTGHSKNGRLFDALHKRMASLSHGAKRLFVKGEGEYALVQKLAAGAGLALLACTSISCGGSTALQGVAQQQQYVRSPAEIVGRHVHFVSEGQDYVGYVHSAVGANTLSINTYDGGTLEVESDAVLGVRIENHADERRQVVIPTEEEGEKFRHGFVIAVYDDNFYEVMIGAYVNHDDVLRIIEFPYVIIINYDEITSVFGEPFD